MNAEILWDEIPAKRQRKTEKYTTPVLTLVAVDQEKKGAARKMILNKAAQEALNVVGEDRVSFGFNRETRQVFIKKAVAPNGFELTKTCTLSDKKTFEFILSNFGAFEDIENEFDLVESSLGTGILELIHKGHISIQFENRDLGEVSEEENTAGDLAGIPATPVGGATYSEAEIVDEMISEQEEMAQVDEAPIAKAPAAQLAPEAKEEENDEEDVW